jgi:hypothetical protein
MMEDSVDILQQFKEIIAYYEDVEEELESLLQDAKPSDLIIIINDTESVPWNIVYLTRLELTVDESVQTAIRKMMPVVSNHVDKLLTKGDFDTVFSDILNDVWDYENSELKDALRKHAKEILSYLDQNNHGFFFEEGEYQYKYEIEQKLYESGVDIEALREDENQPP